MENIFCNEKEFHVGDRIFTCNFNSHNNKENEQDGNILMNEKNKKNYENTIENAEKLYDSDEEVVDKNLKIYLFNEDIGIKIGTIRYIGTLKNHPSQNKIFYGIEWDNEISGKNYGKFKEDIYFYPIQYLKREYTKMCYMKIKEGLNNVNVDNNISDNIINDNKTKVHDYIMNDDKILNNDYIMKDDKILNNDYIMKDDNCDNNPFENFHNIHNDEKTKKICEKFLNVNLNIKPCSFLTFENIHVGITFIQALHFRYNYFPDLDLSIEDYQTKKIKKVIFSGEMKVRNYFKNFYELKNITLNKCLIYTSGITNNLIFNNLHSLSLCGNLLSNWLEIFKIIKLANKLTYLNVSDNKLSPISLQCVLLKNLVSECNEIKNKCDTNDNNTNKYDYINNNTEEHCTMSELIYFEQIKELCIDNTLISWDDVLILSFIFPNVEILSLKKNYINNINIKNLKVSKNSIIYKYLTNTTYRNLYGLHNIINDNPSYGLTNINDKNGNSNNNNIYTYKEKNIHNIPNCNSNTFMSDGNKRECVNYSYNNDHHFFNSQPADDCSGKNMNKSGESDTTKNEILFPYKFGMFTKLRKIVLNDNYLYDYEDLFNFVYHINSIQSIFLNNNKFSDNTKLIDIVYNICIEDLNYKMNENIEPLDKFEIINQKFNHLKEFLFDNNEVQNYETLRDLFYIFYDIEILKIQNKQKHMKDRKNLRYIFISIMPKLKILNHSSINKNERINSERFFISLYQRDNITKVFNEEVLNRRHSTRLEKIHYEATKDHEYEEKAKCIKTNLINITIIPEFLNSEKFEIVKKKVSKYMYVKDLKYLCSRLYSIPLPRMRLFYTDENNPICLEILDTNANLYTYGIDNNSKIKIKMEE
ncbi:cytoskeleton associated protein, putative [Plasmodium sp. gorilla clade G2]|uniref:cytoskeleton associated protein, putative n=1 Tax=Plasmodium sp. gorilla clade G2 TaxID=880535 RepID=UPI000D21AA6F|nr:cytoskeleton associated protein, putative [Plasmodium sp. gorilla clade G2]SOV12914.1 cytoskeleton associated protein, putative [Plasmodium sp. gorilla clade G2]